MCYKTAEVGLSFVLTFVGLQFQGLASFHHERWWTGLSLQKRYQEDKWYRKHKGLGIRSCGWEGSVLATSLEVSRKGLDKHMLKFIWHFLWNKWPPKGSSSLRFPAAPKRLSLKAPSLQILCGRRLSESTFKCDFRRQTVLSQHQPLLLVTERQTSRMKKANLQTWQRELTSGHLFSALMKAEVFHPSNCLSSSLYLLSYRHSVPATTDSPSKLLVQPMLWPRWVRLSITAQRPFAFR